VQENIEFFSTNKVD